jgi:Uma2 family endonuclease
MSIVVGMSMPAPVRGVTIDEWLAAEPGWLEWVEVSNGEFVAKRLGGNPHHYLASRLSIEFERQWPGVVACPPANWAMVLADDGRVIRGRLPDVLVDGESLRRDPVFVGRPHAVVEVWSPTNTLAEMNGKRREYRDAGAAVFLEAFLTDALDVHLQWYELDDGQWELRAAAEGNRELRVDSPRPFSVVPNALLG